MKTMFALAAFAGLLASGLAPALAQDPQWSEPTVQIGGGTVVDDRPTPFSHGGSCVKMCENDYSPCDPDYYKISDRRCNRNQLR